MSHTMRDSLADRHLSRLENVSPSMAKADLKKVEEWRGSIGKAVQRALSLAGVTQKEAAGLLDRDQAQIARWISGAERPQLDAIFAVELLRQPIVQALAECAGPGVEVVTEIRIKRIA